MMKRYGKAASLFAFLAITAGLLIFVFGSGGGTEKPGTPPPPKQPVPARADDPFVPVPAPSAPPPSSPKTDSPLLKGRVVDVTNHPLPGATVIVMAADRGLATLTGSTKFTATAGEDGTFAVPLPSVKPKYDLWSEAEGYTYKELRQNGTVVKLPLALSADGLADAEVVMFRVGKISGRVVDQRGKPVKHVTVHYGLRDEVETGNYMPTQQATDAEGRFVTGSLKRAGDYLLWGRYAPWSTEMGEGVLALGDESHPLTAVTLLEGEWKENVELRVTLDDQRFVEGRVVDPEGNPVAGAQVWAYVADHAGVGVSPPKTPETGAFRIERILLTHPQISETEAISQVIIAANKEGYEPGIKPDVAVGAKGVEVVLQPERRGTLVCHLYDAQSGSNISGAEVYLTASDTEWGEYRNNMSAGLQVSQKRGAVAGWFGKYTIENVPAGKATILINADGYGTAEKGGFVIKTGETTGAEVPLEAAGLLCVHVLPPAQKIEGLGFWCRELDVKTSYPDVNLGRNLQGRLHSELRCSVEETVPNAHKDFVLAPGEYRLQIALAFPPDDQDLYNSVPSVTVWYHNETVTVEAGKVSSIVYDVPEQLRNSGRVEVTLPSDSQTSGPMLVSGEYNGFLEKSPVERWYGYWDPAYRLQPLLSGNLCTFDVVPSGHYTFVYYPYWSKLSFGKPIIQTVTVSPGETKVLALK